MRSAGLFLPGVPLQDSVISFSGGDKSEVLSPLLHDGVVLAAVLAVSVLAFFLTRKVVVGLVRRVAERSRNRFDDLLVQHGVLARLVHVLPAVLIYWSASTLRADVLAMWVERFAVIYLILLGTATVNALLNAVIDLYQHSKAYRGTPIKGYVQTVQLLLIVVAVIFVVSVLIERSPWKLLSGLGAVSAILLLVFKDSIMGLVASIQINAYDMVNRGDWIEMPKYGADGDVIDVSLHTVKVQNWDKTITTIPTQALITDGFKNWRGMSKSGGRRIKRALYLDMNSIHFCSEEMLDRYEEVHALSDYIRDRRREVVAYNRQHGFDTSVRANGRNLTNIGCFRAYCLRYLQNHPRIHQEMTLLVRQLPPGENGLPIELYCFTNDTRWAVYEDIQADLFDHFLATIPEFGLRVYQAPAGADMQALTAGVEGRIT